MIDKAKMALDDVDIEKRSFTGITLRLNPDQLSDVTKKTFQFQDRLIKEIERFPHKREEVYQFNFNYFPLTKDS